MNPPEQIEMSYRAAAEREDNSPRITSEEIGLLLNLLRGQGWQKSAVLRAHPRFVAFYGAKLSAEAAERKIRAVANASGGQVLSYPGSPGYKLTLEATPEEMKGIEVLRNQAQAMEDRYLKISRCWHGKIAP